MYRFPHLLELLDGDVLAAAVEPGGCLCGCCCCGGGERVRCVPEYGAAAGGGVEGAPVGRPPVLSRGDGGGGEGVLVVVALARGGGPVHGGAFGVLLAHVRTSGGHALKCGETNRFCENVNRSIQ